MRPAGSPPRRTPRQARSRAKVERILVSARELLIAEGPDAFNTNRIAREAGIGIGSLYEYFPDKQAILDQLLDEMAEREARAILERLEIRDDSPPLETVRIVAELLYDLYREHLDLYRALRLLIPTRAEVGSRPLEQTILRETERILAPHASEMGFDDLKRASFTLFHLIESLAFQLADRTPGRWPRQACIDEIVRAAAGYLKA